MPKIELFKKKIVEKPSYKQEDIDAIGEEYNRYQMDGKMTVEQENKFYSDKGVFHVFDDGTFSVINIPKYEEIRDKLDIYHKQHRRVMVENLLEILP
jgi:hypothetical protein